MAGYCTNVHPYFHKLQARENTAQECKYLAILPSHTSNNRFIIYYSDLAAPRRQTASAHAQYKGRCCRLLVCFQLWTAPACVQIPPPVVNSAIFIHNKTLYVVSEVAMNAFH